VQPLPPNLYTAAQARALDRHAIDKLHIPGYALMRRAGEAAFQVLRQAWPAARRIAVLCGGGNNGGDGYVVARLAREAGLDARVLALTDPAALKGDARQAREDCAAAGVAVEAFDAAALADADVLVDGLFGTGLDRPLEGAARRCIDAVAGSARPVLALDLPSGLNADSGAVMGTALRAAHTVTFIGLKLGLFMGEGPERAGEVHFAALLTAEEAASAMAAVPPAAQRIAPELLRQVLPPRPRQSHKGDFGRVLIIGGGPGMPGAVCLAGEACLRAGAGLVTVATHPDNAAAVIAARPELICHGVNTASELHPLLDAADVVALGPGLGVDGWAQALFDCALSMNKPMVIDADGLNLLARAASAPAARADRVLTPHPGEAARLLATDTRAIQADRLGMLQRLVQRCGGIVVLKGAGTLVGHAERIPALCDCGNPGMASAGMGDVLTGLTAALLAQIPDPWTAVRAAVLAHALAGDAAARAGQRGTLAGDVIAQLRTCLNPPSH
jgi:NAD(P)H-hydrate epimerase